MPFKLQKADSEEWARWWVVYRNTNEDYSQSFEEQYNELTSVPFCYWILQDEQRVGGLITVKNQVGDVFFIPPFENHTSALQAIMPEGVDHASSILKAHVAAFEQIGFTVSEARHWMLRPTQAFDVHFNYQTSHPVSNHISDLAELFYAAFHGGIGSYGQRDVDTHRASITDYFEQVADDTLCQNASLALYDGDKLIAACLVQQYKSHPTIRFVVTHPDYQGQGIGQKLMQYAINILKDEFSFITLAVTVGNPAADLYRRMGFVAAPTIYSLQK